MDNVNFNLSPFDESKLKDAINRLAYLFSCDMDWIPKTVKPAKFDNKTTTGDSTNE